MAEERDLQTLADIRYRARTVSYREIIDDAYLDSLTIEHYREKVADNFDLLQNGELQFLVAESFEGAIRGFLIGGKSREADRAFSHEIYALYVDPECQGKGVGKELFGAFTERVTHEQGTGFFARTLRDNPATRAFYDNRGGVVTEESVLTKGEKNYPIVCYTWKMTDAE